MRKIFVVYGIFLLLFSIFSYLFVDKNLIYLKFLYSPFRLENGRSVSLIFLIFVMIFFIFYFSFLKFVADKKIQSSKLKILISISIIIIFSYPAMLSYDIFNYIATAKVSFFYHENPYIIMPIEFSGDPILLFMHAANKTALYGPLWIILSGIPFLLGFNNFMLILFNFKFFALFFYILTIYILWKLSRNIFSISVFALNPLVLIETLVSAHNDIFLLFFALSSFYLIKNNKYFSGSLSLVFSILIKYASIFILPAYTYLSYLKIKKRAINWDNIYVFSAFLMMAIFFLSAFREEIYPWYSIWFLGFVSLVPRKKLLFLISMTFSFSLLLRYIPYMWFGTYFGSSPLLKSLFTFSIPVIIFALWVLDKKLCLKKYFHL